MVESGRGGYGDGGFTGLERAALVWLDGFYQLEHLLAARFWAISLAGSDASEELKFAALIHDAERFFPGGPSSTPQDGFDNADYLFAHSKRSADIVDHWLDRQAGVPEGDFRRRVRALVLRHEFGGNAEEDLLQAADSLSFLSTFDWLVVQWVRDGHYTVEGAREKLDWMVCRIRVPQALHLALPMYSKIVSILHQPERLGGGLVERRRLAGDRAFLVGENLCYGPDS